MLDYTKPFDISTLRDYKQAKNGRFFYKTTIGKRTMIEWVPSTVPLRGKPSI